MMKIEKLWQYQIALQELNNLIAQGFEGNPEKEKAFLEIAKAIEFYEDNILKVMPLKVRELETAFLELINNYLENVAKTAQIFKEEFGVEVEDLGRARFEKTIPMVGSIKHRNIIRFNYHGIGLCAEYTNKTVDFDFYTDANSKSEIDGFDSWRLFSFAQNYKKKYKAFLEQDIIDFALKDLAEQSKIVKANERQTSLWILNTPSVKQTINH